MRKKNIVKKWAKRVLCSIAIGLTNGFFGGGGGMICVPLLENIYEIDNKKSHATTLAIILPLSIVSSVIYFFENNLNFNDLIFITIGVVVGGVIGAVLLKKLNSKIIRIIFALVMVIAGIRMVI